MQSVWHLSAHTMERKQSPPDMEDREQQEAKAEAGKEASQQRQVSCCVGLLICLQCQRAHALPQHALLLPCAEIDVNKQPILHRRTMFSSGPACCIRTSESSFAP